MNHIMFDLETLDTSANAAIIQIGACYFDPSTGEVGQTYFSNVVPDDNATINEKTVMWWLSQPKEAQEALFANRVLIEDALPNFLQFVNRANNLWSHATFDFGILQNTILRLGLKPINYKFSRDIRTLTHLSPRIELKTRKGIHHNALDDAKFQVQYTVACLNALKGQYK